MIALALVSVAGCGYSAKTKIEGRDVTLRSASVKSVDVMVLGQQKATFRVDQFTFAIDRAEVSWGPGETLALPSGWKRVDFIDEGTHIAVRVNGKAYGEIRPAA